MIRCPHCGRPAYTSTAEGELVSFIEQAGEVDAWAVARGLSINVGTAHTRLYRAMRHGFIRRTAPGLYARLETQ